MGKKEAAKCLDQKMMFYLIVETSTRKRSNGSHEHLNPQLLFPCTFDFDLCK